MVVNFCTRDKKTVKEIICKNCTYMDCRYAGQPTTSDKCDPAIYGTQEYWEGETDDAR